MKRIHVCIKTQTHMAGNTIREGNMLECNEGTDFFSGVALRAYYTVKLILRQTAPLFVAP